MKKIILPLVTISTVLLALARLTNAQAPGGPPGAAGPFGQAPGASGPAAKPIQTFKDCPDCPDMVVIPAGTFTMGSDPAEIEQAGIPLVMSARERPRHPVAVRSFAIGRTEITRGLYARFGAQDSSVEKGRECGTSEGGPPPGGAPPTAPPGGAAPGQGASGMPGPGAGFPAPPANMYEETPFDPQALTQKNWRNPGFVQRDTEPAVCVSYNDAKKFVAWLSKQTGKKYRLPTDAEWEYAARGGTTTARYWGNDSASICKNANIETFAYVQAAHISHGVADELLCNSDRVHTIPVGSLMANPFGLYDVIGNVAEVVEGCAHPDYNGAPTDGSAWDEPGCKIRNWRGASYVSQAWLARSAAKIQQTPNYRNPDFGLRVARDLAK